MKTLRYFILVFIVLHLSCITSQAHANEGQQAPLHDSVYIITRTCLDTCVGEAGVAVTGGTAPYHYHWQPGGDTTATVSQLCFGAYHVTVTDANNTTITDSVQMYAIIYDPLPLFPDKSAMCPGDTGHICAVGFPYHYWSNGDTSVCITVTDGNTYTAVIKDEKGCTIPTTPAHIVVYPVRQVDVTMSGDSLFAIGTNWVSYQWYFGSTLISWATSPVLLACETGSYYVQVTDSNGCKWSSAVSILFISDGGVLPGCTLGIPQTDENSLLNIYPNPTTGSWQLAVDNSLVGGALQVFDEEGRMVFQSTIRELQPDISLNIPGGIYYLRISTLKTSVVRKLVKL